MGDYPRYQPPSPEETARRKSENERHEALKNTRYTLDQLLDMAEKNAQYKPLLEKALIMASAGFNQPKNREKIATWPDAIKSDWGVDAIASLNQRVQKEGISVLREFGNTELSALDVMLSVESVSFSFSMASREREQLEGAVMGTDWHEQVTNLLLKEEQK